MGRQPGAKLLCALEVAFEVFWSQERGPGLGFVGSPGRYRLGLLRYKRQVFGEGLLPGILSWSCFERAKVKEPHVWIRGR